MFARGTVPFSSDENRDSPQSRGDGCAIEAKSTRTAAHRNPVCASLAAVCLIVGLGLATGRPLQAAWWMDSAQGTSSGTAQREAIRSIPTSKLDAAGRVKVAAVLNNVTLYRRMPIRAVPCDPDLHLFLIRHPDVIVNIWEVLGVAQLKLRQSGTGGISRR